MSRQASYIICDLTTMGKVGITIHIVQIWEEKLRVIYLVNKEVVKGYLLSHSAPNRPRAASLQSP